MSDFNIIAAEQFRNEIQLELQQDTSVLRETTTKETVTQGDGAYFPVIGKSSGLSERAGDGEFPFDNPTHTRVKVSIVEKAVKDQIKNSDLQEGQVDAREAVVKSQVAAVNREFDNAIITALDATTTTFSLTSNLLSSGGALGAVTKLYENKVPNDGGSFGILTPKAWARMINSDRVGNLDWVTTPLVPNGPQMFRWLNVTWMMHPNLPGVGTSGAKIFLYHKSCVGHACAPEERKTTVTPDEPNRRWMVTSSLYHGAKIIQTEGVIEMTHDDTAAIA